jgi:hypothetical protein
MRKLNPARLLPPLALLCALASSAVAQTPADARSALSTFPDSQAVLFVNAHRIVNDVLPRVMTPAEYQKMLDESKKVGFDVRGLQFAAAGVRFNGDAPAGTPPEFVVVIKGNFNADSMLALGKIMMAAKNLPSRTETYGSKTIEIIDTEAINKSMNKGGAPEGADGEAPKPKPFPYTELAVTALDSNTLVAGVPAFVRSAVDASGGQGALNPTLLGLASQEPDALWSLTAELPPNLAEMAHKYGAPANQQFDEMVGWVRQLNISQGMTALDFTLGVAVTTDRPEHASAFSGLVRMGQTLAENMLREAASKSKGADAARARRSSGAQVGGQPRRRGHALPARLRPAEDRHQTNQRREGEGRQEAGSQDDAPTRAQALTPEKHLKINHRDTEARL